MQLKLSWSRWECFNISVSQALSINWHVLSLCFLNNIPVSTMPMFLGQPSFLYCSIWLFIVYGSSFFYRMHSSASMYMHFLVGWILTYNGHFSKSYQLMNDSKSSYISKLPSTQIDMSQSLRYLCGHIFNMRCFFTLLRYLTSIGIGRILHAPPFKC